MAVRVHHRNGVALLDTKLGEAAGQLADAITHLPVRVAREITIDDFLIGRDGERRVQKLFDQQRIAVRIIRALNDVRRH